MKSKDGFLQAYNAQIAVDGVPIALLPQSFDEINVLIPCTNRRLLSVFKFFETRADEMTEAKERARGGVECVLAGDWAAGIAA